MIYPPSSGGGSPGAAPGAPAGAGASGRKGGAPRSPGRGGRARRKAQPVVQWKQRNVQEGLVVVDEQQLSRLIKRDPIGHYYELDPEPFATGLFASVRRCRARDTGQHFAAKFSSRARYGDDCSAEIHHEIALLSLCSPSPRIVRLHDVFETELEIIIVLEFAPGGDLQTIIDDNLVPFESDVLKFVRQLVEGLAYLHERKIAHLDIKPQNLVMMADFPDCDVKLCDFEISRVILEGTEIREILGTPDYVAPEILHYEPITLAADMWSLGVTTYVLLTGFSPFGGETDQETFCNISRAQLDFPEELFEGVSEDARDFIRRLLVRDPSARPTAKECLRHRWFSCNTSLSGKTVPPIANRSESLRETSSAGHNVRNNQKNLRKYLSKSREALFERVVQQQHNQKNSSLRKTTLLSQYHKTRLCESQMSLVSKSRERLLMGDHQLMMSPSFSRSREKLYGLRSLSRSHEVLDLCKGVGGVATASATPGLLRSLTRATTADLSMLPFWRQQKHLACTGSSTTSIPSSVATEYDSSQLNSVEDVESLSQNTTTPLKEGVNNIPQITGMDVVIPQKSTSSLDDSINTVSKAIETKLDTIIPPVHTSPITKNIRTPNENGTKHETVVSPLLSPTLLKISSHNQSNTSPEQLYQEILDKNISSDLNDERTLNVTSHSSIDESNSTNTEITLIMAEKADGEIPRAEILSSREAVSSSQEECFNEQIQDLGNDNDVERKVEEFKMNISDSGSDEEDAEDKKEDDEEVEDEEPRYTVAQLVSAFNRHQEVITKTSLEVTMTTSEKGVDRSLFPTGPNALRLFIPDIDIRAEERPQYRSKHQKMGSTEQIESTDLQTEYDEKQIHETPIDYDSKEETDNGVALFSNTSVTITFSDGNIVPPKGSIDEANVKILDNHTCVVENVDSTNNNHHVDNSTAIAMCQLVIEAPECSEENVSAEQERDRGESTNNKLHLSVDVGPQYMRSGSLSSDASLTPGTPSETAMSWEELSAPSGTKQQQRRRSSSATADPTAGGFLGTSSSWGRVCTGSYTRAMEKFGGKAVDESERKSNRKSLTLLSTPQQNSNEKTRRKSSPLIKPFN